MAKELREMAGSLTTPLLGRHGQSSQGTEGLPVHDHDGQVRTVTRSSSLLHLLARWEFYQDTFPAIEAKRKRKKRLMHFSSEKACRHSCGR